MWNSTPFLRFAIFFSIFANATVNIAGYLYKNYRKTEPGAESLDEEIKKIQIETRKKIQDEFGHLMNEKEI